MMWHDECFTSSERSLDAYITPKAPNCMENQLSSRISFQNRAQCCVIVVALKKDYHNNIWEQALKQLLMNENRIRMTTLNAKSFVDVETCTSLIINVIYFFTVYVRFVMCIYILREHSIHWYSAWLEASRIPIESEGASKAQLVDFKLNYDCVKAYE